MAICFIIFLVLCFYLINIKSQCHNFMKLSYKTNLCNDFTKRSYETEFMHCFLKLHDATLRIPLYIIMCAIDFLNQFWICFRRSNFPEIFRVRSNLQYDKKFQITAFFYICNALVKNYITKY